MIKTTVEQIVKRLKELVWIKGGAIDEEKFYSMPLREVIDVCLKNDISVGFRIRRKKGGLK